MYFITNDGDALWGSDGTPAGTVKVGGVRIGTAFYPEKLRVANQGTLYLIGRGLYGRELWKLIQP